MASLAQAIRTYRHGTVSPGEFFAQIEHVLASDGHNSDKLLAILDEEHTNFPLPPDVYVEVKRRIERLDHEAATPEGDETRVLTNLGAPPKPPPVAMAPNPGEDAGERIKGVGDTLNGRFVLEECLGFGGMGMVYKALDLRKLEASDRKPYIAIKVLNVQFRGHPKSLIALQREAKKAQTLAHPNIVTVYDFDRDGSMVYLTMELLSGKPLRQVLRAPDFKGMPYAEALPIITGVGKALAYAHQRGFVHCDLKPANIFLTDNGEVKVIDFGIARVFRKPDEDNEATVFDPGSLGGMTPTYASAEMLEHRDPDPRDDIYALGCIAYELLTGHHPFDRLPATQARAGGFKLQRPADLGHRQWHALREALSFDREKRTASIPQFLQGISGQRRPAEYVAMAGTAMLALLLLVAGAVYFWGGRSGTPEAPAVAASAPEPARKTAPPPPASAAAILAALPCSALTASSDGNGMLVRGFIPPDGSPTQLKTLLGSAAGSANLAFDVRPVNDNDCGVIGALAPYWRHNQETGRQVSIRTRGSDGELKEGDSLIMDITTPAYNSFVNIDYYALDGSVVHLVPSPRARDNQAPASYAATVGSPGGWVVAKPFGKELIVLLITPVPLFDNGVRPEHEPRDAYLEAVEQQLARISGKYGTERLAADFLQVTTSAKR